MQNNTPLHFYYKRRQELCIPKERIPSTCLLCIPNNPSKKHLLCKIHHNIRNTLGNLLCPRHYGKDPHMNLFFRKIFHKQKKREEGRRKRALHRLQCLFLPRNSQIDEKKEFLCNFLPNSCKIRRNQLYHSHQDTSPYMVVLYTVYCQKREREREKENAT